MRVGVITLDFLLNVEMLNIITVNFCKLEDSSEFISPIHGREFLTTLENLFSM